MSVSFISRNWIFLGDSLTEGVGSKRVSHLAELAKLLRADSSAANVHEFRLRHVDGLNGQIEFNVAGLMNVSEAQRASDLWLWNLASEGQTIESDFGWLPLVRALRPELVVVFRGSLESIVRPAMLFDGTWPWWMPLSWRGYAAMDPRCYFSTTWWRRAKQSSIDGFKQKARLRLLKRQAGRPLLEPEKLAQYQRELLEQLRALGARVLVLGLLPVGETRFPGSRANFESVNEKLRTVANASGVEFFDWGSVLRAKGAPETLFYRDSFHPNEAGARALAEILREYLCEERAL